MKIFRLRKKILQRDRSLVLSIYGQDAQLPFGEPLRYFTCLVLDKPPNRALRNPGRFPILDALRILLAFWVTMSHFGVFPLFAGADTSTLLGRTLVRGWSSLVWGIPAVIGFFVISGFCIHLPYRHDEKLSVAPYYARRYLRILVPVAASILIIRLIGNRQSIIGKDSVLWNGVLWSLFCEEIYYAVYPLARSIRKRFGWGVMLAPAFLIGALLAIIRPGAFNGSALGTLEVAIILYPIWLLGCVLAEQTDHLPALDSRWVIWMWRALALGGSWFCEMAHFKRGVSIPQVSLCFGVLAYFWIKNEIAYSSNHQPWAWFASAGLWSYSLYLIHIPAMTLFRKLSLPSLGYFLDWSVSFAFIVGLSYLFYLLVERPSHRLARKFTARARPESGPAIPLVSTINEANPSPPGHDLIL